MRRRTPRRISRLGPLMSLSTWYHVVRWVPLKRFLKEGFEESHMKLVCDSNERVYDSNERVYDSYESLMSLL